MTKFVSRMATALLLLLLVAAAPLHAVGLDAAAVPPRQTAPNDQSAYRRFVLPNGMKVLLLSDPKLNVASAAVAVGVGSLSDPPSRPGLAHYLEHMLFLGTEKFPGVEEFGEYLQRNGGYNNAYTARDRTNYHLEAGRGDRRHPDAADAHRRGTARRSGDSRAPSRRRGPRPFPVRRARLRAGAALGERRGRRLPAQGSGLRRQQVREPPFAASPRAGRRSIPRSSTSLSGASASTTRSAS